MGTQSYLMTEYWLKEFSPIGEWCDTKMLKPFIKTGEEIHCRSLIGKAQYDRLIESLDYENTTSDEQSLIDILLPTIAYFIVAQSLPFISNQIRNSGVVKTNNANIINSDFKEVSYLETRSQSISDYYAQRVLEFICENKNLYPLIQSTEDPQSNSTTRYGSFYFGDTTPCECSGRCNCGCSSY